MPWIITGIIISYLIGSIPTAYIFGRVLKGIDIRKFGSGNVGATNALRVLGKKAGIVVLIIDIFKGLLPVYILATLLAPRIYIISDEGFLIILGLSCIIGHNWTIFLNFKGGKGIATTLGVLLALAIKISTLKLIIGLAVISWLIAFLIIGIVSVASVIGSLTLPLYMYFFKQSEILVISSVILCIFVIIRHKSNLKRFFQGKEKPLFKSRSKN